MYIYIYLVWAGFSSEIDLDSGYRWGNTQGVLRRARTNAESGWEGNCVSRCRVISYPTIHFAIVEAQIRPTCSSECSVRYKMAAMYFFLGFFCMFSLTSFMSLFFFLKSWILMIYRNLQVQLKMPNTSCIEALNKKALERELDTSQNPYKNCSYDISNF